MSHFCNFSLYVHKSEASLNTLKLAVNVFFYFLYCQQISLKTNNVLAHLPVIARRYWSFAADIDIRVFFNKVQLYSLLITTLWLTLFLSYLKPNLAFSVLQFTHQPANTPMYRFSSTLNTFQLPDPVCGSTHSFGRC